MWTRKGNWSTQRTRTSWKEEKSWLISQNAKGWRSSWDCFCVLDLMDISVLFSRFIYCIPWTPNQKPGSYHLVGIQVLHNYWTSWDTSKPIFKNVTRKSYCPNSSHLLFCLCCWTERQLVWFITKWPGEERFFSYCWMFWKDPALESFPE